MKKNHKMKLSESKFSGQIVEPQIDKVTVSEEEEEKKKGKFAKFKDYLNKHKVVKWILILGILLIVFLASLFITIFGMKAASPKEVELPNLAGMTLEEAKQKYTNLDIKLKEEAFERLEDIE